jgi:hypothetical protein
LNSALPLGDGSGDLTVVERAVLERTKPGAVALSEQPDTGWVAAWAACEERPDAAEHAGSARAASTSRSTPTTRRRRPSTHAPDSGALNGYHYRVAPEA